MQQEIHVIFLLSSVPVSVILPDYGKVFENSDNWIYLKFEATLHGGEHA